MQSKPLTRAEIEKLYIKTRNQIATIHREFQEFADAECKYCPPESEKRIFRCMMIYR